MDDRQEKLEYLKENPKNSRGYKTLIKHLEGKKITFKDAILAQCFECNGYMADGRADCEIPTCPLYPYNPDGKTWQNRVKDPKAVESGLRMRKGNGET